MLDQKRQHKLSAELIETAYWKELLKPLLAMSIKDCLVFKTDDTPEKELQRLHKAKQSYHLLQTIERKAKTARQDIQNKDVEIDVLEVLEGEI